MRPNCPARTRSFGFGKSASRVSVPVSGSMAASKATTFPLCLWIDPSDKISFEPGLPALDRSLIMAFFELGAFVAQASNNFFHRWKSEPEWDPSEKRN